LIELDEFAPAPLGADWEDVLRRAGMDRRRRVPVAAAVALAALAAVCVATPLGAAIAHGFSTWISGEPGTPASPAQQRAFERANAHSFFGFPAGTQLRVLETVKGPGDREVQLLGFRSAQTLCLRVVVALPKLTSRQSCAPLAELRHAGPPARAVDVDDGYGRGHKHAWYGTERFGAPALQVTAGITADGVRSVTLHDETGSHTVRAVANAFLYVAWDPGVDQRVDAMSARTAHGLVDVPFAPAPWAALGGKPHGGPVTGPAKVQRDVRGGTIGWLTRREPVGQPLSALRGRVAKDLARGLVYGRLLNPSPGSGARYAITLARSGRMCGWTITGTSAAGGCGALRGVFTHSPISPGTLVVNGSDEFALVGGFASDDVHRVVAYLSAGGTQRIPVVHNAFLASIARSRFPVRLVAYDAQGRIIAVPTLTDIGGGAEPARGKAKPFAHVTSPSGVKATMLTSGASDGGLCWFITGPVNMNACPGARWSGDAVQLGGGGADGIWYGRVKPGVARVVATLDDGRTATIAPLAHGLVLWAVPRAGDDVRRFTAYDASGKAVGAQRVHPLRK
jgi:hypothetical protein